MIPFEINLIPKSSRVVEFFINLTTIFYAYDLSVPLSLIIEILFYLSKRKPTLSARTNIVRHRQKSESIFIKIKTSHSSVHRRSLT